MAAQRDRSSREGERASRYVKGRSKYRANWHDSHTIIGCLACEEGEPWRDRDPLGNEAYYNEPPSNRAPRRACVIIYYVTLTRM